MKPVINIDEIQLDPRPPTFQPKGAAAERYDATMGQIAPRIGAKKLGYNVTAVPPGKRAYPRHNHNVNEEMFYIISGTGDLQVGDEHFSLRPGDVIACPPGGPETSHQIVNTGSVELRYLCVSTKLYPELVEYPQSGKFGVMAEKPPGPDGKPQVFRYIGKENESADYWEGE